MVSFTTNCNLSTWFSHTENIAGHSQYYTFRILSHSGESTYQNAVTLTTTSSMFSSSEARKDKISGGAGAQEKGITIPQKWPTTQPTLELFAPPQPLERI